MFKKAERETSTAMSFSIAVIFQAVLLVVNALAILSEKRFLSKFGLAPTDSYAGAQKGFGFPSGSPTTLNITTGFGADVNGGGSNFAGSQFGVGPSGFDSGVPAPSAFKMQIAQFLGSVRMLLRWPLILINIVVVVFKLIFG